MASKRYVVELKSSGETNSAAPIAYDYYADALAAAVTAAPAAGYRIVDSWELGRVIAQTTALKPVVDQSIINPYCYSL